jgi:hypothetical protein
MQQPHEREVTVYADITEVLMETRAANYKKLIVEGWVMLEAYPLTMVGDEARGRSRRQQSEQQPQDTQRRVHRLVGWERNGNVNHGDSLLCSAYHHYDDS